MRDANVVKTVYAEEYQAPAFLVDAVALTFTLHPTRTRVESHMNLSRNPARQDSPTSLWLDGEQLELVSIHLDGEALSGDRVEVLPTGLWIHRVPERFTLDIQVVINPEANSALEGLYVSHGMFCTQCEAQGFRRITYYPDRPDVLTTFTTTIWGDKTQYPLLLSNGNPVAHGDEGTMHWVRWEDPFPKPCYLFALVGGDLGVKEDVFVTASGRQVTLRIYAEPRDLDKLDHAMTSLKNAMRWDEETFGREYDLDLFMIVAVSHFNMGAMENKGLNIFNTSCVLAHPTTTTDAGFQRVEAVVAHEYFHNWSGNRVTCRDWFQLSLKEGFTVYREHAFSADMNDRTVKRVEDVNFLRSVQFPEDQGPMAHPVRPSSYQKIDNFYTTTIYEKGAEVVRMQAEMLGKEGFRTATDDYFARFDGQAVTCDDFVACVERAGGQNLTQFKRWYSQAGTPQLVAHGAWDGEYYDLTLRQRTPPSPGQPHKEPFVIPVACALIGEQGPLSLNAEGETETVLLLDDVEKTFRFRVDERPVPSLLRRFSAPVSLDLTLTPEDRARLVRVDDDGYVRWDAMQGLYMEAIDHLLASNDGGIDDAMAMLTPTLSAVLTNTTLSPAEQALLLALPSESMLAERQQPWIPSAIVAAREALKRAIATHFGRELRAMVARNQTSGPYRPVATDIGKRSARWCALGFLASIADDALTTTLRTLCDEADNMTDGLSALLLLTHYRLAGYQDALAAFATRWQDDDLVMDKWFSLQASRPAEDTIEDIETLLQHPQFTLDVPNRARTLIGGLGANAIAFHQENGEGYRVFFEQLRLLDARNPQVAARLATATSRLRRLAPGQQERLRAYLEELLRDGCSDNLREVVQRVLDA